MSPDFDFSCKSVVTASHFWVLWHIMLLVPSVPLTLLKGKKILIVSVMVPFGAALPTLPANNNEWSSRSADQSDRSDWPVSVQKSAHASMGSGGRN